MKWDHEPDDIEAISNEWDGLVCDIYEAIRDEKKYPREITPRWWQMAMAYADYYGYDARELAQDARQTWEMNRHG